MKQTTMQPFTTLTGLVAPLDRVNVDTIPRLDANVGCIGQRPPVVDDALNGGAEIERLRPEARHPALGTREVQDVLDEMHEATSFLHDDVGRRIPLGFRADAAKVQRFREKKDLRKRCSELVRNARDEVRS